MGCGASANHNTVAKAEFHSVEPYPQQLERLSRTDSFHATCEPPSPGAVDEQIKEVKASSASESTTDTLDQTSSIKEESEAKLPPTKSAPIPEGNTSKPIINQTKSKALKRFSNAARRTKRVQDFARAINLQLVTTAIGKGEDIAGQDVLNFLERSGLQLEDPRIRSIVSHCQGWKFKITDDKAAILLGNNVVRKALRGDLVVRDFKLFTQTFTEIYHEAGKNLSGGVATYIPQLARQNPDFWAAAVCTVDGQRFGIGDVDVPFCVQSTSKPITYCAALEINGESKVHEHVGQEPSGRNFNERCLMARPGQHSIPHNPYINAGAIMTASLVKMDISEWDRFSYTMGIWQKLSAGVKPSFQNDTFMGERATASRNFCLAYIMEEEKAFPAGTDLHKTLEAYFSWCSIEVTSRSMAMIAATLANGGICPTTTERIFTHQTVTNCLSLMMSCGMYDYSGRFAFEIGFPSKSGVSGVLCVVIPGVCGIATFSPRLDCLGNSVRGIDFCTRLSQRFPYHVFSQTRQMGHDEGLREIKPQIKRKASKGSVVSSESETRRPAEEDNSQLRSSLWWSAATGDELRVRQLAVRGMDLNDSDYDHRSSLHLAASEGHESMVRLLIALEADITAEDHYGNTPMDDAIRAGHLWALPAPMEACTPCKNKGLNQIRNRNLFRYFKGDIAGSNGKFVPKRILLSALDNCGLRIDSNPRFGVLDNIPDAFTKDDLDRVATKEPLIAKALSGQLIVPNFALLSEKLEELFSKLTPHDIMSENQAVNCAVSQEALNVMTIDGQHLHLGSQDQYLCAGDLISVALFAVSMELLGLDSVIKFVSLEPSGVRSCSDILNSESLPYNPFMWNGVLALCSLLEENFGDAIAIITDCWAKLCGKDFCSMQYDEVFEEEDKRKNFHRVSFMVHKSLDLQKFPTKPSTTIVVNTFFRLRALKTSTTDLGIIAAVFANGGVHPQTSVPVFRPDTVKNVLSMMYSAGCESQSGELSFKVGMPTKSSREGAILIVWPNIMGLCIISPEVQENGVSVGGLKFCTDFGNDFNCHVLAGSSTSSGKHDPSLYHFQTDMELCNELLFAAERADMMTLSKLHHLGFRLDTLDYDYRSAAHLAAENGKLKVLKYLWKKGVDMRVRDRWGNRPIDGAVRKGQHKAASLLKDMLGNNEGVSKLTDVMSTSVFLRLNQQSSKNQCLRVACPVAAKTLDHTDYTYSAVSSHVGQDVDEEEDAVIVTDEQAALMIQRRFREKRCEKRKQTTYWETC